MRVVADTSPLNERGLLDIHEAIVRLQATSFRSRPALLRDLVKRHDGL